MRSLLVTAGILVLAVAGPANAASFTVDDYSISQFTDTNNGLSIEVTKLMGDNHPFTLTSVGQSHTTELFRIGTNESSIEDDDVVQKNITVNFTFSAPAPGFGGAEAGLTGGTYVVPGSVPLTILCAVNGGCGYVIWDAPAVLTFGTTGQLKIQLSDELFLTPGSAVVDATFTLLQQDTPVSTPEPGTMALVATGIAAAAARLRRRSRKV
jgi:hypothetical protein